MYPIVAPRIKSLSALEESLLEVAFRELELELEDEDVHRISGGVT